MKRSTVSVIMPSYNSKVTLASCIEAVLSQLKEGDELIVVDDRSDDGSELIPLRYQKVRLIRNDSNLGAAGARNVGADAAIGEILVFVDADVLLEGNEISTVADFFHRHLNVHSLTGMLEVPQEDQRFFTCYKNLYMNFTFRNCAEDINFIYGSFCALRRSSYFPWPTSPRLGEDSHWGYLQVLSGLTIRLCKDIKVKHLKRYSLRSLTVNDFKIASSFAFLFLKHKRWKTVYSKEQFGHTSKLQKVALFLAVITLVTSFVLPGWSVLTLVLWFFCVHDLIYFIYQMRGVKFAIASVVWTFFDHLIYTAGIIHGTLFYCLRRSLHEN